MNTDNLQLNRLQNWIICIIVAGSFALMPSLVKAQMFSVKNSSYQRNTIPHYHIYAGVGPAHFSYRPKGGKGVYAFNGQVGRLVLEAYNFKLFLKKGIGLGHHSFFETGIQAGYGLQVYRNQKINLQIPLQLQAGITAVTNENQTLSLSTPSFREGTISVRTGADFKVRLSSLLRLGASIIPHFGLTYSTGRYNGSGTVWGLAGNIRLYLDHLFGKAGLSFGYSYDFRKFNVKGNLFDYNAVENCFLIGVTF